MKFAFFPGCKIPYYLEHYATATKAVLSALDVELVEIEFNCCGYPIRNLHFESFLLSAARNMALAREQGLDILTPCKCCFGAFKHAEHFLKNEPDLQKAVNASLKEEGLVYQGNVEVKHLLPVLARDIGLETLKARIRRPFEGLRLAAHYGCHALRPSQVTNFDDPLDPTIFEDLIGLTGAESVSWPRRLECCGQPLWGKNDRLSLDLMHHKIDDARQAGADYLCVACTYCQIQFDTVQSADLAERAGGDGLPSILYPQLLGLSMGLAEEPLGLDRNQLDLVGVLDFLK